MMLMKSQLLDSGSENVGITLAIKETVSSNDYFFSTILQSQRQGKTCLPFHLGLSLSNYALLNQFLCDDSLSDDSLNDSNAAHFFHQKEPDEDLRQELLTIRHDEWVDLRELLVKNRSHKAATEMWMAEIVAAACLGGDHLWRDLGLPNRQALSVLLDNNFHPLAKDNTKDMKWKKFFYKKLCEQDGGYVCRAPSCEQCKAYDDCFGLED